MSLKSPRNRLDRRTAIALTGGFVTGLSGCFSTGDDGDRDRDDTGLGTPRDDETVPNGDPYELDAGSYRTIVIFRNDDPHPGYQEVALRDLEDVFLEAGVPVTHGVIPAAPDGSLESDSAFCETFRRRDRRRPGLFEYSLHGYHHQRETEFYGASEFGDRSLADQRDSIARGVRLLEDCVGWRPSTFIPPFNTYDSATVEALTHEGIEIISGGTWFTRQYYGVESGPFEADGALHVPNTHDFVSDWSTIEFHTLEELKAGFDAVYERGDLYVPMLHYQYFTTETELQKLAALIEHVGDHEDVGFTTLAGFGWQYDPA